MSERPQTTVIGGNPTAVQERATTEDAGPTASASARAPARARRPATGDRVQDDGHEPTGGSASRAPVQGPAPWFLRPISLGFSGLGTLVVIAGLIFGRDSGDAAKAALTASAVKPNALPTLVATTLAAASPQAAATAAPAGGATAPASA